MKKITILVLASLCMAQPLFAIDLPPAPSGFTWQEAPEIKAAFLKPDGWYFKHEESGGTLAYFITKENLAQTGWFNTGLTVNVFHLKQDSAVTRGKDMIDEIAAKAHVKVMTRTEGPFEEALCERKDTDSTGSYMVHTLTVANPKTNTLYLFIFESPAADWNDAWKLGDQIMNQLAIDDGI